METNACDGTFSSCIIPTMAFLSIGILTNRKRCVSITWLVRTPDTKKKDAEALYKTRLIPSATLVKSSC